MHGGCYFLMKQKSTTVILFLFLAVMTSLNAYGAELDKSKIMGGYWNYKKFYFSFLEDGKFMKEIRLRGRKVISSCKGKYKIKANVIYTKNCPRLGSKENFEVDLESLNDKGFKAIRVSFSSHTGPDGSRSKPMLFKRVAK